MNPWMLHEVRRDDVAARYQEAERSRIAAKMSEDTTRAAANHNRSRRASGIRRAAGASAARWAVGIALVASLAIAALTAFA